MNAVPMPIKTPAHGDDPADVQVVPVGPVLANVVLPDVVGEHRVERADVGRHAGHERRQQAGQRDAERPVRAGTRSSACGIA